MAREDGLISQNDSQLENWIRSKMYDPLAESARVEEELNLSQREVEKTVEVVTNGMKTDVVNSDNNNNGAKTNGVYADEVKTNGVGGRGSSHL